MITEFERNHSQEQMRGRDEPTFEWYTAIFELPEANYMNRKEVAIETIKTVCPDGWTPDLYFGSQNSFFRENGKEYARVTIRRWIEKD